MEVRSIIARDETTMSDDPTLPPHRPNTTRVWLTRLWRGATGQIAAYPDRALIVFLALLAVAVVL